MMDTLTDALWLSWNAGCNFQLVVEPSREAVYECPHDFEVFVDIVARARTEGDLLKLILDKHRDWVKV